MIRGPCYHPISDLFVLLAIGQSHSGIRWTEIRDRTKDVVRSKSTLYGVIHDMLLSGNIKRDSESRYHLTDSGLHYLHELELRFQNPEVPW